jgi:hypothetical protein
MRGEAPARTGTYVCAALLIGLIGFTRMWAWGREVARASG